MHIATLMLHGAEEFKAQELITPRGVDASALVITSDGLTVNVFMPYSVAKVLADAYAAATAPASDNGEAA